jgi:hypothetical protein
MSSSPHHATVHHRVETVFTIAGIRRCAVNDEEKKVYFSVWVDQKRKLDGTKSCYIFQEPGWGIDENGTVSPARRDHDEKLTLVFDQGYEAYGYFIVAEDPTAEPRKIAETRTGFVFSFELKRQADGTVLGLPKTRINIR